MEITAEGLGKRFQREWIFRELNYTFLTGEPCAITGPNGSGKSTLLSILSGQMPPSQGKVRYRHKGREIPVDDIYRYLTWAAPYMELIEEFTLTELLKFHFSFKKYRSGFSERVFLERTYLAASAAKPIRFFSSGMKQRLKLGLALFSEAPILLLDEPASNLDSRGLEWYLEEIKQVLPERVVLICSNQPAEYGFCKNEINLTTLKPSP